MRTFKKIISIVACTLALQVSANQSTQGAQIQSKMNTAITIATGVTAATIIGMRLYPIVYRSLQSWWNRLIFNPDQCLLAIASGDETTVRELIQRWGTHVVKFSDSSGYTALHHAALNGHVGVTRLLLEAGACPSIRHQDNGETPLHRAAAGGHDATVRVLLEHGAQIDAMDSRSQTPLYKAILEDHEATTQLLLEHGAKADATMLRIAALAGHEAVVRRLLEQNVSIEAVDSRGHTAMFNATLFDHAAVVRLLLAHGASIDSDIQGGETLLQIAVSNRSLAVARLLIKHGAELSHVQNLAAYLNNPELRRNLKRLSRERLETIDSQWHEHLHNQENFPNDLIDHYIIPLELPLSQVRELLSIREAQLHRAATNGNMELLKKVMHSRVNVNAPDQRGYTPLHKAALEGRVSVAQLLLAHGAQVDAINQYQQTPLHKAAILGRESIARLLLAHDAQVDATDQYQQTPLHWAAYNGQESVARLLLAHGAQVDATAQYQQTPLHWAAYNGQESVARLLLAHGAQVDATDQSQQTPLHKAVANDYRAVAETLVTCGAELARIRNLAAYQNNPELRRNLECLSRERLQVIDNHWRDQLHDQGLYNDITDGCILPLALPQLQLNELAEIRQANTNWETHKDLYESIE